MNSEKYNNNEQAESGKNAWQSLSEIEFDPDKASRIRLEDGKGRLGEGRDDRATFVRAPEGEEKRNAYLMLGKNKENAEYENGDYLSISDVEEALAKNLEGGKDLTLVAKEDYAEVELAEVMRRMTEETMGKHSRLMVGDMDSKRGGDLREVVASDVSGEHDARGVLMLGEEQNIANGEYLTQGAIKSALSEYMIGEPKNLDTVILDENNIVAPEKQKESVRKWIKRVAAIAGAAIIALTLINPLVLTDDSAAKSGGGFADPVKIENSMSSGLEIGDVVSMPEGVEYHESSDYDFGGANAQGEIGNTLDAGDYTVESYSVLDPETHQVVADNVTWEQGQDLDDHLEEIAQRTGQSKEDLANNTRIHIAETDSGADAGWIDYGDNQQNINNGGR